MQRTVYHGVVKDGRIWLDDNVQLPEDARVTVTVAVRPPIGRIVSPRLGRAEQRSDFVMQVVDKNVDE